MRNAWGKNGMMSKSGTWQLLLTSAGWFVYFLADWEQLYVAQAPASTNHSDFTVSTHSANCLTHFAPYDGDLHSLRTQTKAVSILMMTTEGLCLLRKAYREAHRAPGS